MNTTIMMVSLSAFLACQPLSAQQAPFSARYLVLICIDGCRPDYFDFSNIPNIRKPQIVSELSKSV